MEQNDRFKTNKLGFKSNRTFENDEKSVKLEFIGHDRKAAIELYGPPEAVIVTIDGNRYWGWHSVHANGENAFSVRIMYGNEPYSQIIIHAKSPDHIEELLKPYKLTSFTGYIELGYDEPLGTSQTINEQFA